MHVLAWNPFLKKKKNTQYQLVDLPEAATVMHRSRANRVTWPSISGKFKFEVLVQAESGSLRCDGTQAQWLKCPCLVAEQQWLWKRTIPVFKDRKVKEKRSRQSMRRCDGWLGCEPHAGHSHTRRTMLKQVLYANLAPVIQDCVVKRLICSLMLIIHTYSHKYRWLAWILKVQFTSYKMFD